MTSDDETGGDDQGTDPSDGDPDPGEQPGPRRQRDVYMQGMADVTPDVPVSYEDLEAAAEAALSPEAHAYVAGGAGSEDGIDGNREAFRDVRIVPRMLRGVEHRDLSVRLDESGLALPSPLALAPVGVQSIVHPDAEPASARAAAAADLPFVHSSAGSTSIEDLADAAPDARLWFQLYPSADPEISRSFLSRAEAAGYEAVVITVDTPLLSWRERDVDLAYLPFLDGEGIANYVTDPAFRERLDVTPEENELAAIREFVDVFGDPSLTWSDLDDLVAATDLPVFVKGVCHPEDARMAVERGAEGVVVSNHGGRQVGGVVPALRMLPAVATAVGERADVLYDSGIRRGPDVIKALALGADATLVGRPYVYGLAVDGEHGVSAVCENLLADVDLTLGLAGRSAVADLDESLVHTPDDWPDHGNGGLEPL